MLAPTKEVHMGFLDKLLGRSKEAADDAGGMAKDVGDKGMDMAQDAGEMAKEGGEKGVFLEGERQALRALSQRIDQVFPCDGHRSRAFLFRLTRATEVTARALRRLVATVLSSGRPD